MFTALHVWAHDNSKLQRASLQPRLADVALLDLVGIVEAGGEVSKDHTGDEALGTVYDLGPEFLFGFARL